VTLGNREVHRVEFIDSKVSYQKVVGILAGKTVEAIAFLESKKGYLGSF